MRTPWIWSVSFGRWWNVQVGLHIFFVLFIALAFFLSSHNNFHPVIRLGFPAVLLISVVIHEIAHVCVARRLGGVADEIIIGPLGGLSSPRVPYEPQSELVMLMAGASSIRDVMAFPKTQTASCLLTQAPAPVSERQLRELSIRLRKPQAES